MKFTVLGFQQAKLIENGLTTDDALALRVIKDMFSSASMEFKDYQGIKFMWVNYTYLLEQIPIIGSKRNLMNKIDNFRNKGLIVTQLENSRNGKKGNFSYISPTVKLDELQDYDLMQNFHKGYEKNAQGVMKNLHDKDTSIKDTSIKDKTTTKPIGFNSVIETFTRNEELKNTIIEFIKMRKSIKKPLTDHALDLMLKDLNKLAIIDNDKIQILNNSIKNGWHGVFALKPVEVKTQRIKTQPITRRADF